MIAYILVHQAFWDLLREELSQDPPEYEHALILLGEIKEVNNFYFLFHYF